MLTLLLLPLLLGPAGRSALDLSQCIAPLGMESGQIPDRDLSASSSFNDGNVGPQNGRLNQELKGGAWCPRSQITAESAEWLEIDLRSVHVVTAAGTQGRFGNGQGQEFAEHYRIEYWRPRLGKWVRYRTADSQEVLPGNTNTYLEQKNQLKPAVWAQKIRFIPHSSHRRTVCMRVELYGCLWTAGIVSYSMPRGHKRSNGVELSDSTYDGVWGAQLEGGLGLLVDGAGGGDDIRELGRPPAWLGWRNDSLPHPPHITFEFDRVREFSAVHIYTNNRFMRDVQVFSMVVVSFSVGGRQYQQEVVRYVPPADGIFESARNVTVNLRHRIGRWVRLQLHFAARWILISEVVFESDVAQGNYTLESVKPPASVERAHGEGGAAAGSGGGAGGGASVASAREDDPLYVALGVGVLAALAILLCVAVSLLLHRHRHRKCFASPVGKLSGVSSGAGGAGGAVGGVGGVGGGADSYSRCGTAALTGKHDSPTLLKTDEYQEPYQALKCAPYFTYSTVLLEMKDFVKDSTAALSDSSAYEYAVPELSSAPLLSRRASETHDHLSHSHSLRSKHTNSSCREPMEVEELEECSDEEECSEDEQCSEGEGGEGGDEQALLSLKRRLETTRVPELPRHRLRMISKLAEGAFGTVYLAEAEGVREYGGRGGEQRRLVAVKFLCADASPTEREEFERDVRILSALSCSALSRVVGWCRSPPPAVVLEYLPRGELCGVLRVRGRPLPLRRTLHVAVQVAQGMKYLESLNFVHRDLAARNILVGEHYQIKISDFGTDNEAYASDYYKTERGIPLPLRWAAWESALAGRYTTKSDVWAFAVLLYELFTACRRPPYDHLTDRQVVENLGRLQCDGSFECLSRPGGCPRDLYDVMRACWRRDPPRRPAFTHIHTLLRNRLNEHNHHH